VEAKQRQTDASMGAQKSFGQGTTLLANGGKLKRYIDANFSHVDFLLIKKKIYCCSMLIPALKLVENVREFGWLHLPPEKDLI